MGNSRGRKDINVSDGALASGTAMGGFRSIGLLSLCCFIGMVGSQSWMPLIGLLSDMYRQGTFLLGNLVFLALPYLIAFATVAALFSMLRVKSAPSSGVYGALVGAVFSCLGAALLLLFDAMSAERIALLFVLVGLLLGTGNCLMVLFWSTVLGRLRGKPLFACSVAIAFGCCSLAAFAQMTGGSPLLLVATIALSVVSAGAYWLAVRGSDSDDCGGVVLNMKAAYARMAASLGCFGFLFAAMIMQFAIAPHGQASWFTWVYGFAGIAAAAIFLGISRVVRASWDFLFAYRFVAIPVLIAFFPFEAGSDFSLKFALWFSTMALWCFLVIAPGVIRESSAILHVPVFYVAGIAVCGLCVGAVAGYLVALVVEMVDPSPNYYINISAIIAMALGLVASNIVLTRGSLARSFRKASASVGENEDSGSSLCGQVGMVVESYGLTSREADVLAILARGHGLSRVQEDLFISEGTAITHRRHIYQKLDVHSKSELIDLVARFSVDDCEDD